MGQSNSREESGSGLPSPARWSTILLSSWPTNPPAHWIVAPATRFYRCSRAFTAMVTRSSWLRMPPKSPIVRGDRSPCTMDESSRTPWHQARVRFGTPSPWILPHESSRELANRRASASREQTAERLDRAWDRRWRRSRGLHGIGGSWRTGRGFGEDPHAGSQPPARDARSPEFLRSQAGIRDTATYVRRGVRV